MAGRRGNERDEDGGKEGDVVLKRPCYILEVVV